MKPEDIDFYTTRRGEPRMSVRMGGTEYVKTPEEWAQIAQTILDAIANQNSHSIPADFVECAWQDATHILMTNTDREIELTEEYRKMLGNIYKIDEIGDDVITLEDHILMPYKSSCIPLRKPESIQIDINCLDIQGLKEQLTKIETMKTRFVFLCKLFQVGN